MPTTLGSFSTDQFVFFGDSLSDNGNLAAAAENVIDRDILEALIARGGQVSNGPVFADGVAGQLGLIESLNYAVAGGEAGGIQTPVSYTHLTLPTTPYV